MQSRINLLSLSVHLHIKPSICRINLYFSSLFLASFTIFLPPLDKYSFFSYYIVYNVNYII